MENKNLEDKTSDAYSSSETQESIFDPQYTLQESSFDSLKCRCACAPSPGPYCRNG